MKAVLKQSILLTSLSAISMGAHAQADGFKFYALLDGGLSLAQYHLPLDAHPEIGNNTLLAEALGSKEHAEKLAAQCRRLDVEEGVIIASQGDAADSMHFILEGRVGIVSKSGTLTYEAIHQLSKVGMGQTTCIGIGGDPLIGPSHIDALKLFADDPDTEAVIQRRLTDALGDMAHWKEFDYLVVNRDFDVALEQLGEIVAGHGERARTELPAVEALARSIVEGR